MCAQTADLDNRAGRSLVSAAMKAYMRRLVVSLRWSLFMATLLGLVSPLALAEVSDERNAAPLPSGNAADYLEFESVPDGRCQILSAGGKLRLVHNRHAERGIEFRLLRMFAGNHRQGLVAGQLAAGEEGMKLGCTKVDGRPQDWVIQRARYMDQD